MRTLANEYYLKNGSIVGISSADVSIGSGQGTLPSSCVTTNYFYYYIVNYPPDYVGMRARRCVSGGKAPDTANEYLIYSDYYPASGIVNQGCVYIVGGNWDGNCPY